MRLLLFLLLASTCLRAQSTVNVEVAGGLAIFTPLSSFTSLSDVPNPGKLTFTPNGGSVHGFGSVGADLPFADRFRAGLRAGLQGAGSSFTATEKVLIAQPGGPYLATLEHSFSTSILMLNAEPYVRFAVTDWLHADVGLPLMMPIVAEYTQTESFTDPAGLQFTDGSLEQTTGSGKIRTMRSPTFFASARLSALLPINDARDVFLTPQIDVQQSLQSLVTTASIPAFQIRFGVGIRVTPRIDRSISRDTAYVRDTVTVLSSRVKQPITEIASMRTEEIGTGTDTVRVIITQHYRTTLPKPPSVLRAAVRIAFVGQGGKDVTDASVRLRRVRVTRHVPLLPVVVFTQLESGLPARYIKLPRREAMKFSESQIRSDAPIHWQYNVLNVIGSRMIQHPQTSLTIHGVDDGSEMGATYIRDRMESIRTYMQSSFNIAPSRLRLAIDHAERYQDWITLVDTTEVLTAPLVLVDTITEATLPTVRIYPDVVNDVAIRAWSVTLTKDSNTIRSFADTATSPTTLSWNMNEDVAADSAENATIMATLSVFDVEGNVSFSPPSRIHVRAPQDLDPTAPPFQREEYLVISSPTSSVDDMPLPIKPTTANVIDVWNASPSASVPGIPIRMHAVGDVPWFRKNLADPELYFWQSETRLYTKE